MAAWWQKSFGYEVYLRSFADGNADGVGDLPGLLSRLDHLEWLGVDLLWITPFYESPMRDHGYDVADHCAVDPVFGTLDDLDAVLEEAHDRGMRVLVDLVPNHTSSDHPWFVSSRSSTQSPHRDWYIWRDPAPGGGPPNNWLSNFGGRAWSFDVATGQWWCHLFLPEQPDLDWRNPEVAAAFDDILRFWLGRGVDGFRIDVAHALVKHRELPDNPPAPGRQAQEGPVETAELQGLEHVHDIDQHEVLDVYRRWRPIAEQHDALLLGEVYLLEADRVARYVTGQDGLHLSFWFPPMHARWHPDELRAALMEGHASANGFLAWAQGSHDRMRATTRFGGGEVGRRRALALAVLLAGMPGTPFVYQGEELGMTEGTVPAEAAADPVAVRAGDLENSRDGCRTPMLWQPGPGWGFTTAGAPWLPFGDDRVPEDTVAAQRADERSTLQRYRRLIHLRRASADLVEAPLSWLSHSGPLVAYRRGQTLVAANCGGSEAELRLPGEGWRVAFATDVELDDALLEGDRTVLAPAEAVVLVRG